MRPSVTRLRNHVAHATALGPVEHALGALVVVAVDEVAAEALQHRRVGVGPPLPGEARRDVERVLELTRVLDLLQGRGELVLGPGLVGGRDADAELVEDGLAGDHDERDVVVAVGVRLVVELAEHGREVLRQGVVETLERGEVAGPGPVGHVRAVDVEDARQLLARRGRHDRLVVGVLGEGLDLDLVLALAGVVVVDDRRDGPELGLVAGVVGPHRQLSAAACVARAAAAALATGSHRQGERGCEQADGNALGGRGVLHRFLRGGKVSATAKTFQHETVAAPSEPHKGLLKPFHLRRRHLTGSTLG